MTSLFEQAGALNAFMLVADSKPIMYEEERAQIRDMLQHLNLGISA